MSEGKSQQELDFERKHEEALQRLCGLRLIDDDFMAAVFEDRTCAEFLLQIILKRDDLTVKEAHGQYFCTNRRKNQTVSMSKTKACATNFLENQKVSMDL